MSFFRWGLLVFFISYCTCQDFVMIRGMACARVEGNWYEFVEKQDFV